MDRREVILKFGGLLLVLPAARVLMACGGSDGTQALTFISSNDLGHTHTVALQMTDLTAPPPAGVNETTSFNTNHTHQVALTAAELDSIQAGTTVTKTTSTDDGHSHTFAFHR